MKKIIAIILSLIMLFTLLPLAAASQRDEDLTVSYRTVKIAVDGKLSSPRDASGNIIEPFIYEGTTYLPVRGISSALGLKVDFDSSTNTVVITKGVYTDSEYVAPVKTDDAKITASYRDVKITVGGIEVTPKDAAGNDIEPFIYEGTTYLPVRGISAALGREVSFDTADNTVYVGLQPVENKYSLTSPAPSNSSQLVLVNNEHGRFVARISISRLIESSAAEDLIYQASPNNKPLEQSRKYGLVSLTITIIDSADKAPVKINSDLFKIYTSNNKEYTFPRVTNPRPTIDATLMVGQSVTGYYAYVVPFNERYPKLSFGEWEGGHAAYLKLYNG